MEILMEKISGIALWALENFLLFCIWVWDKAKKSPGLLKLGWHCVVKNAKAFYKFWTYRRIEIFLVMFLVSFVGVCVLSAVCKIIEISGYIT